MKMGPSTRRKAGSRGFRTPKGHWIPACAGMTALGVLAITPAAIFTVRHRMIRAGFAHCDDPIYSYENRSKEF